MSAPRKYLIWDFDGTLAYREGKWSGAIVQVIRRFANREVDIEAVRPLMREGFPWDTPERPNPPNRNPDDWWRSLHPQFERAFAACDISPTQAQSLAAEVRATYLDLAGWRLYDDTREVLAALRSQGWRHAILSNHVPELRRIVEGLGLDSLVDLVVNSAETGFEKPHAGAFRAVLDALSPAGVPPDQVWMIGDNIRADVLGAESAGLPAILVRTDDPRASRRAATLREVSAFFNRPPGDEGTVGIRGQ